MLTLATCSKSIVFWWKSVFGFYILYLYSFCQKVKDGSSKNRGIKVFRSQQPQMDCFYKHSCSKRQLQGLGIAATLFARVWLAAYFEFSLAHFSISVPCKLLEMFFYPQCNSPSRRIAATNPMGPRLGVMARWT